MSDALPWIAQGCIAVPGIAAFVTAIRSSRTAKSENKQRLSEADLNEANADSIRAKSFVDTEKSALENALAWRAALQRADLENTGLNRDLGELRRARDAERLDLQQQIRDLQQLLTAHDIPLP